MRDSFARLKDWSSDELKTILKAAVLTLLALGFYHENASAAEPGWASKCSKFGALKPNENPSFQHMNCLLTSAAIAADVPPEVVKGVASQENGKWEQFDVDGNPIISLDGGIGIMQITNKAKYDQERLQTDVYYNIEKGVEVLAYMYTRTDIPKITNTNRRDIESWYFAVMAYNGTKPVNSPITRKGVPYPDAYQERVFRNIENDSLLGGKLVKPKFKVSDFDYNSESTDNIKFPTMAYEIIGPAHPSAYFYKKGEKIATTIDGASLRPGPATGPTVVKPLGKFSALTITGEVEYDTSAKPNQFVWIPVRTLDNKVGYISSAYVTKPVCTPCLKYNKGQKIYWEKYKWELTPGLLGRLTILQDTELLTKDGKTVGMLKKGLPYKIYAFREGELSVGGGLYVKRDLKKIAYETPSKEKLDAVKCIANFY
ncbi:transglycosylase SLT domain-containing protein [Neobacillus piezotolerans]|uniref:transglycosylase SLT domain-containing protein n=1 Tax=Neobacillus piezotolerans TaxID=2259171 RepID=UPI0015F1753B|nr:transglycosylase SLT domain-containing protein [Neobacillus piezotolerans]